MQQQTVTLGERQFELRPLKLGQLRHVLDALEAMAAQSGGGLIEAAAAVVARGLAAAHPELTPEMVLDLEATIDELNAAVAAILTMAGLKPAGEAMPVASGARRTAPDDSSARSTAPSPPAAATATATST